MRSEFCEGQASYPLNRSIGDVSFTMRSNSLSRLLVGEHST